MPVPSNPYPVRSSFALCTGKLALVGAITCSAWGQQPPAGTGPGFGSFGSAAAEVTGESLVRTELLPATALLEAGKPFRIAVVFRVQRPWHLYWKNPGDSGGPPSIRLELPPGFTAGPLEFPTPKVMESHGEVAIGYEGDIACFLTITPPESLDGVNSPLTLTAALSWMVCTDRCLLGKRTVAMTLPAVETPIEVAPEIAALRAIMPMAANDLKIECRLEGGEGAHALVITGPAITGSTVRFLPEITPGVGYGASLPAPVQASAGRFELRIPLMVRPENSLGMPLRAAGLVTISTPRDGTALGEDTNSAEIALPLNPPNPSAPRPVAPH
ncbi:MAG: protein-disulfide reductase DsbD family protein [Phycisphaerae bacterium]|nr:protein-disulfide reductase DsbD family protein [Phycisphaerae bacterium]